MRGTNQGHRMGREGPTIKREMESWVRCGHGRAFPPFYLSIIRSMIQ